MEKGMKSGRNHSYPAAKLFLTVLAQTPAIPLQCLRSVLALHEIPLSSHTVSLLLPAGNLLFLRHFLMEDAALQLYGEPQTRINQVLIILCFW